MEKDPTIPNSSKEFEELKRKYEELQLRTTRFSVTEQELIYARNRLDREVLIYRRMQQFNSLAFEEMKDEIFIKRVCEALLDIFELEIGLVIIMNTHQDAVHLRHLEGCYMDPPTLDTISLLVKNLTKASPSGIPQHVVVKSTDPLYQLIPFKTFTFINVWDPELNIHVVLLCGNTEQGSQFYENLGVDREAAFSVFAQQVLAHITNRFKTQKIKQHVSTLTQDQERITRIAESFLKFDTQPEKNIKQIVRLAAELLSAECAVLESLNGDEILFSKKEINSIDPAHINKEDKPCYELMRQSQEEMIQIPQLDLSGSPYQKSWIRAFEGFRFIGSVIQIDQQPIGTLALFIEPNKVITKNLLQLNQILSVAIAVEERRKRALNALKESEEKYRVMFEGSPNGILVVDIETMILQYVNPSICNMFGYTPDEMLSMKVYQLHPASLSQNIKKGINNIKPQSNSLINDVECIRKDGSSFYADIYSNFITFGGRRLAAGFFSEVTQRIIDRQALLESNAALKKTNSELDNFVYSVSHDLRSPLLAIQGLVRLINDSTPSLQGETAHYLDMVMASTNRMDDTIKEILEYSRNARLALKVTRIDFSQMVNEIFSDVKHIFPKSLSFELEVNGHSVFYSDAYRVNTLLKNIIGNAVKYQRRDNQHPYVKISIQQNEDNAILRFEDNGEGIAAEHIHRIFEMFYRASNTTVGTGLGLYICKEIVENLDGHIEVQSEQGKGSVFTVQIKNLKP